jgi:hypothetical protein
MFPKDRRQKALRGRSVARCQVSGAVLRSDGLGLREATRTVHQRRREEVPPSQAVRSYGTHETNVKCFYRK